MRGPRLQMKRQPVVASGEVQGEPEVLRFVRWVPDGHHGVVAISSAPVGDGLGGAFLDSSI